MVLCKGLCWTFQTPEKIIRERKRAGIIERSGMAL